MKESDLKDKKFLQAIIDFAFEVRHNNPENYGLEESSEYLEEISRKRLHDIEEDERFLKKVFKRV